MAEGAAPSHCESTLVAVRTRGEDFAITRKLRMCAGAKGLRARLILRVLVARQEVAIVEGGVQGMACANDGVAAIEVAGADHLSAVASGTKFQSWVVGGSTGSFWGAPVS